MPHPDLLKQIIQEQTDLANEIIAEIIEEEQEEIRKALHREGQGRD